MFLFILNIKDMSVYGRQEREGNFKFAAEEGGVR